MKVIDIVLLVFVYIFAAFFCALGFFGGMLIAIGELGSVAFGSLFVIISVLITLVISIISVYKYRKNRNKGILVLRFSILLAVLLTFVGIEYQYIGMKKSEKYLYNIGNMAEEYRLGNNIEYLSEDDFKNIELPEDIEVIIFDNGYSLKLKGRYGNYTNYDGNGSVKMKRN